MRNRELPIEVIFECEGCPYWKRTDKEVYGNCLRERVVITDGRCQTMDDLEHGR